jgi:hypothetical protein
MTDANTDAGAYANTQARFDATASPENTHQLGISKLSNKARLRLVINLRALFDELNRLFLHALA